MINVYPNPNFANWYNIVLNGKIIDNARNYAKAMEIAKNLSVKFNSPILSSKQLNINDLGQTAQARIAQLVEPQRLTTKTKKVKIIAKKI